MVVVIGIAFLGGLFIAWAIGATNAPAFGPVNAAGAAPVYRSSLLIGLASLAGAVTQGGSVSSTIGTHLVKGASLTPAVAAMLLFVAAVLIIGSTLAEIPMPSAFLVVGGTLGAAYAAGGSPDVAVLGRIAAVWLLIPFVGGGIGYVTARLLRWLVADTERNRTRIRRALLVLGLFTAYTAGANQAGLPIGPLLNVVDVPLIYLLAFAGLGMLAGALTGSPRLVEAISHDYSRVGPRRATGALLAASTIAQAATLMGVPISFGQTVIFSVIGSGLVEGTDEVGTRKILKTVGAWAGALALAFAVTFALTTVLMG